jgi:DMSO/TMAO reductase YedYZ molybdopterin-dependent catalytic subunit
MTGKMSRRDFLAAAGGSIVSIGLPGHFYKLSANETGQLTGARRADGRLRLPPGQHAVKALHDMGGEHGTKNAASWRLHIHGRVAHPLTLTFEQLMALGRVPLTCDVHCVTGWSLLDARWGGIRLNHLMAHAKVRQDVRFVIFESPEGYTSNIPIEEARKGNVILADTFNDQPLPLAHGSPLRALVPDLYFWKSVKWLQGIKFTVDDEPGFYENASYSNTADPWTEDRFDAD